MVLSLLNRDSLHLVTGINKSNQDLYYLHLPLNLQQAYSMVRHDLLFWGCFEKREKYKARKPSGGDLKILPTCFSTQQGCDRKVFSVTFAKNVCIHTHVRKGQAVQFAAIPGTQLHTDCPQTHCHHHGWAHKFCV